MTTPATREDARAALVKLQSFIGAEQVAALNAAMFGEEWQFFADKAVELCRIIETMPKTGEQDGKDGDSMIYLHYFAGGLANFYIMETDIGSVDDEPEQFQSQAFGLADLFGNGGELGYISIPDILANGGELDLYFDPCTIANLRAKNG